MPDPLLGYQNSSIRDLGLSVAKRALDRAAMRDSFLIRCAAQSACILLLGMPHTFSV